MRTIAICDNDELQLEQAAQTISCYAEKAGVEARLELYTDLNACVSDAAGFDAVFMDIEFEGGPLGIEAARQINADAPNCQIVYLTNYLHYSLDVYQTDHAWYVLKSQLEQRLPEIFQKLAFVDKMRHALVVLDPIDEEGIVSVPCNDIRYFERQGRITFVAMRGAKSYSVRDKVSDLLEKLPQAWFSRCHNSYAVNLSYIRAVRASELILDDGMRLPVSRSRSKQLRAQYLHWIENRNA